MPISSTDFVLVNPIINTDFMNVQGSKVVINNSLHTAGWVRGKELR